MTACPQCGSSLPEARGSKGLYAPIWGVCRNCAWPLSREAMLQRLMANKADVAAVLVVGRAADGTRMLVGSEAQSAVDELTAETAALVPVCEAAGMVAFRRAEVIEFFLFEGASVQSAFSAMAGRQL